MNTQTSYFSGALLVMSLVLPAAAQPSEQIRAEELQPLGATNKNRLGLSYRMGFNISADFKQLGGFAALNPATNPRHPLRTPDGAQYNYDNGFMYPDNTTENAHPGYTWNYGYVGGTPLRPQAAPTQFDLYRASSPANLVSRDNEGDPQHGMELTYNRQFGRMGKGFWGLEGAVGYTDISIEDSRSLRGTAVRAVDTFASGGGAILKSGPFEGNAGGPAPDDPVGWPLVGLSPSSSSADSFARAASVRGHREFDAQVVGFRFGPYLDIPISRRWMFSLSGGLALMQVNSDFSFDETVSIDPSVNLVTLPDENHSGAGSKSDLLLGGYVGGSFSFALNDRFRLFAGAQFQSTGDYSHSESGKTALLRWDQSIFVSVGATFSF